MTAPLPRDAEGLRERAKLAKKWAYLLSTRTFVPLSTAELELRLLGMVERLCAGVTTPPVARRAGAEVGSALVDLNCTTADGLQCSVEVVSRSLLDMASLRGVDNRRDQVVEVVAAFAAGFVDRVRTSTLEQQEQLGRSLYRAMRQAQQDLQLSEARFDLVEGYSSTGLATAELDGRLVRVNTALARIVDHPVVELHRRTLYDVVHPDERDAVRADVRQLEEGVATSITQPRRLLRADGELAWVTLTLSPLRRPDGRTQVVVLAEDDTDVNLLQGQLNHQSLHDVLTRLPNRQYFTSRLERALRTADPTTGISVFHLDLDGFSQVSGGLGRHVGDVVLRTVAARLEELVADEVAMVARFGFDEFAVLIENGPSTPDVVTTVRRINDRLLEPFDAHGHPVAASATIGVVHRPPPDSSPADLLDSADLTLRRAKRNGRRQWELSDQVQDGRDRRTFGLAATMTGAWRAGRLRIRYRPVVRLSDEVPVATEALLRWDHPKLGPVPHEQCLALAQDSGLLVPLGAWVLRRACEQAQAWRRGRGLDVPVRWALTAAEAADPDLVGVVVDALADTGLPESALRLGVPAPVLLGGRDDAPDNLRILAERGIGVEVDEFGAAPADLVRVLELPVRAVRLAHPVVGRRAEVVAKALASLLGVVREAGVEVSVTGVATPDQARWWREVGATTASGPLYAPATGPEALA
ncbi:EAL domain-containing protein [Actinosynnema sp. NPDC020468]|uniref:putative bifunctional diguanylate cyclase/phosphodiesterase n=1 Tax=Actinosynnema sp. NPDC020468 TaxID=3154488 RepID=UPI0033F51CAC